MLLKGLYVPLSRFLLVIYLTLSFDQLTAAAELPKKNTQLTNNPTQNILIPTIWSVIASYIPNSSWSETELRLYDCVSNFSTSDSGRYIVYSKENKMSMHDTHAHITKSWNFQDPVVHMIITSDEKNIICATKKALYISDIAIWKFEKLPLGQSNPKDYKPIREIASFSISADYLAILYLDALVLYSSDVKNPQYLHSKELLLKNRIRMTDVGIFNNKITALGIVSLPDKNKYSQGFYIKENQIIDDAIRMSNVNDIFAFMPELNVSEFNPPTRGGVIYIQGDYLYFGGPDCYKNFVVVGSANYVSALAMRSNYTIALALNQNNAIRIYNLINEEGLLVYPRDGIMPESEIPGGLVAIKALAYSDDGNYITVQYVDNTIKQWKRTSQLILDCQK
jgi:hypothetical protein